MWPIYAPLESALNILRQYLEDNHHHLPQDYIEEGVQCVKNEAFHLFLSVYKATLEIICLGSKVIESFELGLSSLSFEAENLSSALDVCEHFSKLERSLNNFAALQKITKIQESLYDIGNKIQTQPRVE